MNLKLCPWKLDTEEAPLNVIPVVSHLVGLKFAFKRAVKRSKSDAMIYPFSFK